MCEWSVDVWVGASGLTLTGRSVSNYLAVVLRPWVYRDPSGPRITSEWSVRSRFQSEWSVGVSEALVLPGVSWRHQSLGLLASGFPGSLPDFQRGAH